MSKATYCLVNQHVGVCCKRGKNKKQYILDDEAEEPVVMVKAGTLLAPLEDEVVLTPDGESVRPSGRFFTTVETIDPYHMVLDVIDANAAKYIGFL